MNRPAPRRLNLRASAALAICRVMRGRSLDEALSSTARLPNPADMAMAKALAYGVLRDWSLLQALSARLSDKPLLADEEIHALLAVGLYQLRSLGTPAHAAIHETVDAVIDLKRPQAHSLVNAILRRYTREAAALEAGLPTDAAQRHSHPAWLASQLKKDWPDTWEAVLAANNQPGPLTLRVNRRRMSRDEYLKRLAEMSIAAQAIEHLPEAVQLAEPRNVEKIPGFNSGQVSVQDASAQFAVELLNLRGGQRVLDACAAPGGKSAHILEQADVALTAIDSDPQRLVRVDETLRRLGLQAQVGRGDAGSPDRWWDGKPYDRILLDAPCSGTGVIRRHPDIKWLRRETDITTLQQTQLQLLKSCWTMLKPGGRLVYATCSTLRAEGDEVIARFWRLARIGPPSAFAAPWGEATEHGRRLAPGGAHDGFYYAVLDKPG